MENSNDITPVWNPERRCWEPENALNEKGREALVRMYAEDRLEGRDKGKLVMLAAVCPLEILARTPPDELREKLDEIWIDHKASTPSDDDEYWLLFSPFDHKYYVFASCAFAGGGWPSKPVYVLDEPPRRFYEE
jgi:hypothetical protein